MSLITVANPITTIYFVKSYRQAVLQFLSIGTHLKTSAVTPVETLVNSSMSSSNETQQKERPEEERDHTVA